MLSFNHCFYGAAFVKAILLLLSFNAFGRMFTMMCLGLFKKTIVFQHSLVIRDHLG